MITESYAPLPVLQTDIIGFTEDGSPKVIVIRHIYDYAYFDFYIREF